MVSYNDFLMLSVQGFSTVVTGFVLMSSAIVFPISLKSVESVVIPPDRSSFNGVSF
jgi:hypothetical protein